MKTPVALPSFAALALLSGFLLSGCAAPATPVDVSSACASVSTTTTPPTCERPYDTGVSVRLPETAAGAVGAVARGGEVFVTSAGARLAMSDSARDRVLEGNAYASTIYQAQVSNGTVTGGDSGPDRTLRCHTRTCPRRGRARGRDHPVRGRRRL